tara:strand:+ start:472 stop:639 length:168 start_codon:yes stop_codon:yes gene_type:complete
MNCCEIDIVRYTFQWGKHKDKHFNEVPEEYLFWLLRQTWPRTNLKKAINFYLDSY